MDNQYMFRTRNVLEENEDILEKPECQLDDADDAINACVTRYCVAKWIGARKMRTVVRECFGPVAKSITDEGRSMIRVEYDREKIRAYLQNILDFFGSSANGVTLEDIRKDYRCVYNITGWDDEKSGDSYIYDNLSACTPFNTYMAMLLGSRNVKADTFDKAFVVEDVDIPD